MAKSLFFNAIPNSNYETGYDRNYNADDISDWLAVVWENGVVKDGLKVDATTGMTLNVNIGRAAIKGKAYINNSIFTFTVPTAPTAATRYDYIVLKYDNNVSVRDIVMEYRTGTSSVPTISNLTRTGNIYELMLAIITVGVGATSIVQSNITDKRGDETLCPWFTAVKGYADYYDAVVQTHESVITLSSPATVITTNLAASLYNSNYSLVDVYTNGIKEQNTAYTVGTAGGYITITFTSQKSTGAKITVDLGNFIDGEGMSTALAQYTALVADVAELKEANEYTYICNGVNDNVLISNIVKTWLNGGNDYGSITLKIIGTFGYTAMAAGDGGSSTPYKLFDFTLTSVNRKCIVDFTNCSQITVNAENGKYTTVFGTNNITIIGANITASNINIGTVIRVFSNDSGQIKCEDCRFWITGYQYCYIALCGTFKNCRGSIANLIENSYCFQTGNSGILRIEYGEYYAYCGDVNKSSAIVGQSSANAVAILYGVNGPTISRNGYYQTNSLLQWSGGGMLNCTDLVSALPMIVATGISNIRGTITMSKAGQM